MKSDRYRLLHQSVEGPGKDRARWRLVLSHATPALLTTSELRGLDLTDYVHQLDSALDNGVALFDEKVRSLIASGPPTRKELAARVRSCSPLERRLHFAAFDGDRFSSNIREIARSCCENSKAFDEFSRLIDGPRRNDG